MRRLGIAVVGLGYWGPNLARNLLDLNEVSLEILCDHDRTCHRRLQRRFNGSRFVTSMDDVLASPDVDAVVLATPASTHFQLASASLEAGKHVFVEKPLATTVAEAEALKHMAQERELTLMPGLTFLYSPPVVYIHDLIAAGELGDIQFMTTSRVNLGIHQKDVSVIWDLAPHDLSIFRYWLGEIPREVSALSRSCVIEGTPDVAFVSMLFGSGAVGHAEISWLAPSKLRRTVVVGTKKMVVYDDLAVEQVKVFDSSVSVADPTSFGEHRLTYRTGSVNAPHLAPSEPLSLELADFCRCVLTGDVPRANADVGIDVVRVLEAIDHSLAGGGSRVLVGDQRAREEGLT